MSFFTQENRVLKIDTPLGKDVLLLTDLNGCEGVSALFEYELVLVSPKNDIDFKQIVGKSVTISIDLANDKDRYINGIITRFAQREGGINEQTGQAFAGYSATLLPPCGCSPALLTARYFRTSPSQRSSKKFSRTME